MSLNKEMIFGLAFGDNDMAIVPNKNFLSQLRGNNTPYTFSTPIILRSVRDLQSDSGVEYTTIYPDGSSLTADSGALNLEGVYYPAGTTIETTSKSSRYMITYLECKYV